MGDDQWQHYLQKNEDRIAAEGRLRDWMVVQESEQGQQLQAETSVVMPHNMRALTLLKRPEVTFEALEKLPEAPQFDDLSRIAIEEVVIQTKYEGYIQRGMDEIARNKKFEEAKLPDDVDYAAIKGLSREQCEKLTRQKPETIGQASRIQGVTPAAISLLLVLLRKGLIPTIKE